MPIVIVDTFASDEILYLPVVAILGGYDQGIIAISVFVFKLIGIFLSFNRATDIVILLDFSVNWPRTVKTVMFTWN